MKWEYKTILATEYDDLDDDGLNAAGVEGWELASCTFAFGRPTCAIFKRPVHEPPMLPPPGSPYPSQPSPSPISPPFVVTSGDHPPATDGPTIYTNGPTAEDVRDYFGGIDPNKKD
jgi:hypothetical protein